MRTVQPEYAGGYALARTPSWNAFDLADGQYFVVREESGEIEALPIPQQVASRVYPRLREYADNPVTAKVARMGERHLCLTYPIASLPADEGSILLACGWPLGSIAGASRWLYRSECLPIIEAAFKRLHMRVEVVDGPASREVRPVGAAKNKPTAAMPVAARENSNPSKAGSAPVRTKRGKVVPPSPKRRNR